MAVGGSFDTFPKLLLRNAAQFSGRPAFRHKDLGIWQTWTWTQVAEIVRAYAAGLQRLGLQPEDTIAIVGSNRPKLYWTMMAAQTLRAIPVPVYSDAVADELAYVLAHADVKFVAAQDQEQVDKVLSVSDRLPHLQKIVYDEPRGLRDYDHSRLIAIDDVIADGRAALAADARLCERSMSSSGRAKVLTSRSSSTPRERPARRKASCCLQEAALMLRPTL